MSTNIDSIAQSIPFSAMTNPVFRVVARGETQRIERHGQILRVISGQAWVSFDGHDLTMQQGATIRLEAGRDVALISTLGQENVIYELY